MKIVPIKKVDRKFLFYILKYYLRRTSLRMVFRNNRLERKRRVEISCLFGKYICQFRLNLKFCKRKRVLEREKKNDVWSIIFAFEEKFTSLFVFRKNLVNFCVAYIFFFDKTPTNDIFSLLNSIQRNELKSFEMLLNLGHFLNWLELTFKQNNVQLWTKWMKWRAWNFCFFGRANT